MDIDIVIEELKYLLLINWNFRRRENHRVNMEFVTKNVDELLEFFEKLAIRNKIPYRVFDFEKNKNFTLKDRDNIVNEVDEIGGILVLKNYVLANPIKRYRFASAYKDNKKIENNVIVGELKNIFFTLLIDTNDKNFLGYKDLDNLESDVIRSVCVD